MARPIGWVKPNYGQFELHINHFNRVGAADKKILYFQALKTLKDIEWSRRSAFVTNGDFEHHCPSCGHHKSEGHSDCCKLAAMLNGVC